MNGDAIFGLLMVAAPFLLLGGVIWLVKTMVHAVTGNDPEKLQADEHARQMVERRIVDLFAQFPHLTDEQAAQLVYDELVTGRVQSRAAYAWATPYTAGRLRRMILLHMSRG